MIENVPVLPLQLHVLGGLRLRVGEQSLDDVLPQKARALLCFLLIERREHSRSSLADLLWGESAGVDAATNLRQALTQLRRVVGTWLVITRHSVAFNTHHPYWIDCDILERIVGTSSEQSDEHHGIQAVEVYQGDFLHGFALGDAPMFEEWVVVQRERLHSLALQAFHSVAERHRRQGDFAASIAVTRQLLALDAWREEAHRQLMWLLVRTGQRSAALAQYQTCRRILDRELGVEPMAETTALFERIRRAQANPSQPMMLPATPFVGRTRERAELARRLADPRARLTTIVGPGGIGKTRLAMEVAAEWNGRFLDGVHFVPLASVATVDAFISTLVSELACGARPMKDSRLLLREFLRDKDMLLVLDNFEHLVDDAAPVLADLLRHAPELKVLATSRERLQLHDEWLVELPGLDVPTGTFDDLEHFSAVALFVASARRSRPGFALDEADKPAVARICRLVGGTPLGIELSAAWTRLLGCEEIAHEIERSLEFLTTSLRDLPARHRSLRAVFDHSWRLLALEEQQVLRRLAAFRGGFSRAAAEEVTDASLAVLGALIDKSMLYLQPGSGADARYDMHEMVRHYAQRKLEEAGEERNIQARSLLFFVALAASAYPHLVGPDQKHWLDLLDREHDNIRVALQVALEHGRESEAVRMAALLWRFWWTRGHLDEGCHWLDEVLGVGTDAADQGHDHEDALPECRDERRADPAMRALAFHGLGVLRQEQGNFAEAQAHHEQSLALRRALGDRQGVAFSLNSLGVVAADQGDYARAQRLYEESLVVKREFGDRRGISGTLNNLGIVLTAQGKKIEAQALYEESLELCRALADQDGIAVALGNLGLVAFDLGNIEEAEHLLEESLVLFQELGDRDGVTECLEGLAGIATVRQLYRRAARLFGATARIREDMGTLWTPIEQERYVDLIAAVRAELGDAVWNSEWVMGQQMTPDQATVYEREGGNVTSS